MHFEVRHKERKKGRKEGGEYEEIRGKPLRGAVVDFLKAWLGVR
jgi:hypothetical protein